jgi:hypothetical protein
MEDSQKPSEPETPPNITGLVPKPAKARWKKIIALLVLPFVYIAIDGTLTYDIFDFKMDTPFKWFTFLIILALILAIYAVDDKKDKPSKLDN